MFSRLPPAIRPACWRELQPIDVRTNGARSHGHRHGGPYRRASVPIICPRWLATGPACRPSPRQSSGTRTLQLRAPTAAGYRFVKKILVKSTPAFCFLGVRHAKVLFFSQNKILFVAVRLVNLYLYMPFLLAAWLFVRASAAPAWFGLISLGMGSAQAF
jgi:hypothetical protein